MECNHNFFAESGCTPYDIHDPPTVNLRCLNCHSEMKSVPIRTKVEGWDEDDRERAAIIAAIGIVRNVLRNKTGKEEDSHESS